MPSCAATRRSARSSSWRCWGWGSAASSPCGGRRDFAAVGAQVVQRLEVDHAGVGLAGGERAAPDVAGHPHERVPDAHVAIDPGVLLVRVEALDAEGHPEAASVDGLRLARLLAQAL